MQRVDFTGWSEHKEFAATLCNVLFRRDQMRAIHVSTNSDGKYKDAKEALGTVRLDQFIHACARCSARMASMSPWLAP